MGIFKKTIKYSKGSEDLNNKIKNLDEDLKKTGVISNSDDGKFQYLEETKEDNNLVIEEVKLQEEELYSWREVSKDHTEEEIEEFVEEIREKHRKLSLVENSIESLKIKEAQNIFQELYQDQVEQIVEKYISSQSKDILLLREDLFLELDKKPTIDVNALEEKINLLSIKYRRLSEALNDPSKNGDPLNQNPVTLEQLKNHYQILVGRLQEKLASVGGGGEVRLKYLDDIVGIATNASVYDGKYLKYDHTIGKFVFDTINNVTGIGGTWQTDVVGINTIKNVGIGTTAKSGYKLYVEGNTRVTGILTIGQGTITLNGNTNVANIGTGVTIYGDSGIISARAFYLNGVPLVGSQGTQGIQGIQGGLSAQGRQGVQGLQGSQGVGSQGSQGLQGLQGRQGVQGNQGTQGIQGTQGLQGLQGRQGTQGIQGVQGTQGTQGLQGLQGRQGTQGIQGVQGNQGTQGTQGLQGLQGIQGRQGVQGNQGTQGIQGLSGSNAGQGTQGLQGSQGIQGRQGTQGTQGTQGLSGSQGTYGPVAGTANQVVYKDGSNDPAGSVNLIFDGSKLTTQELLVIGNVSVGGTLTYEDVTNIDSVGLITARSGVKIISGGLEVTSGVSTFGSNVKFNAGIRDLNNNIGVAGSVLVSTGSGIKWDAPSGGSGGGESYWASTVAGIHTLSKVGIGTANPTSTLTVSGNALISGVSTFSNVVSFGSSAYFNSDKLQYFGNSQDLAIGHLSAGGGYSVISSLSGLSLQIYSNQLDIRAQTGENFASFSTTGSSLYYNNSKKFETLGTGVTVTGTTFTNQLSVSGVSTFAGITTVTGPTLFSKQLNVSGVSTFAGITTVTGQTLFTKQLSASGIATFNQIKIGFTSITAIANNNFNSTMVVGDDLYIYQTRNPGSVPYNTIHSDEYSLYLGTKAETGGSQLYSILVGIHTGNDAFTNNSGWVSLGYGNDPYKLETIGAGVTINGTTFTNQLSVSGVITASSFVGDGSGLTGVGGGNTANVRSNTLSVSGVSTFAGITTVTGPTLFSKQLNVSGVSTFNDDVKLGTDDTLYFGDSDQYYLEYNGSSGSRLYSNGTFTILSDRTIIKNKADLEYMIDCVADAEVALYYNGSKKFQTLGAGVTVTGTNFTNQLSVSGISTLVGNTFVGSAITMYASTGIVSATTFYGNVVGNITGSITNATNLTGGYANASQLNVTGVTTISAGRIQADAASNLRFGNLPAGSGSSGRNIAIGDQVLVTLSGGSGRNIGIGELSYYDTTSGQYNIGLGIQAGQKITTGSYNVIIGGYNGQTGLDLRTSSNNVVIADGQGNIRQYIDSNGNVGIKTTIITEALTVAGIVSATSFSGSGIGLTNIPASKLTGVLPAIDGSNLFGVTATGSGIEVKNNGVTVGTAATVDFGTGLSVSFASGIATVSGITTSSINANTLNVSGVSTFGFATVKGDFTISQTPYGDPTFKMETTPGNQTNVGGFYLRPSGFTFGLDPNTWGNTFGWDVNNSSYSLKGWGGFKLKLQNQQTYGGNPVTDLVTIVDDGSTTIAGNLRIAGVSTLAANGGITTTGGSLFTKQLSVSGVATASSFSGSGSGLTNLPAGQLTGTLPAIDGSALLNINATGSGVVVLDDNVNVGSARTLNFGSGLDVTYSATGIATITASGGSLKSRTVVTGVTTSIENNGIGNTNITGFKSYSLMKVGLSTAAWLRIYTDSTSRANDVNRSVGEDPTPGSGVIAEVVTTGISTTQIISPFVMGGNLDDPASTIIYAAITNLSGSTQAITANLTILQLEA